MDKKQLSTLVGQPIERAADGFIHPTTGAEAPDGERLDSFYEEAGNSILTKLQDEQPIRIGESLVTGGGNLPYQTIVHIPVQTAPGVPTTLENIQTALRTAIVGIDIEGVSDVILPCPIPNNGSELKAAEVADVVTKDLLQYPTAHIKTITFVDPSEEWITAVEDALG